MAAERHWICTRSLRRRGSNGWFVSIWASSSRVCVCEQGCNKSSLSQMFLHSSVLKNHYDLEVCLISNDSFISLTSWEQARRCFSFTLLRCRTPPEWNVLDSDEWWMCGILSCWHFSVIGCKETGKRKTTWINCPNWHWKEKLERTKKTINFFLLYSYFWPKYKYKSNMETGSNKLQVAHQTRHFTHSPLAQFTFALSMLICFQFAHTAATDISAIAVMFVLDDSITCNLRSVTFI